MNDNKVMDEKLNQYRTQFIDYMANVRKISVTYLKDVKRHIDAFYSFIAGNNINDLNKVTKGLLVQFQLHLYSERLLAKDTVRCHVITLRSFFNHFYLNNLILSNPTIGLNLIESPSPHIRTNARRYYNWQELLSRYKTDHKRKNMTALDLKQKLFGINLFIKYLRAQKVKTIYKIEPLHFESYKEYLNEYYTNEAHSKADNITEGADRTFTKVFRLKQACRFIKFFYYKGYIQTNPAADIDYSEYRHELDAMRQCPGEYLNNDPPKTKIDVIIEQYLNHRISLGFNPRFRTTLAPLKQFLSMRGITDFALVTKHNILEYQNWLPTRRYRDDKKYAQNSILNFLCAIRSLYQFLIKYDFIQKDPTIAIDLPKNHTGLPRAVMTLREVGLLLSAPDTSTILGLRDKAILEVLYSTGMRANEISHLMPEDIDFNQGLVKVTHPKGGLSFQRVIAIGSTALNWVQKYITSARPMILDRNKTSSPYLFVSSKGNQILSGVYSDITKQYIYRTGLRKMITTHSWRVTCATFMLRNGADIRYVQEQLGHHSIRSTQHYTRLVPKDLKKAHHKYHPSEIAELQQAVIS